MRGSGTDRSWPTEKTRVLEVRITPVDFVGTLQIPSNAHAIIAFANGSESGGHNTRNIAVADALNSRGVATLIFDLLTAGEQTNRTKLFDIALLAKRLVDAVLWLENDPLLGSLPLGLFGAGRGAEAALLAAAQLGDHVRAVVSCGGQPELAGDALDRIRAPTLLLIGGKGFRVIKLINERALKRLHGPKALEIVPGASRFFREPGALEAVIAHTTRWFENYLEHHTAGWSRTADKRG